MPRILCLALSCALALVVCAPGRGQDTSAPSPSLADIARQAQKDKANKPPVPVKVVTNDDIPSRPASSAPATGSGRVMQSGAGAKSDEVQSPEQGLEKLQSVVDQLDSMDRATLVSNALDGNEANFPGRAKWEEKLFAAKQTLASQTRAVLQKATELEAAAQGMKDIQD